VCAWMEVSRIPGEHFVINKTSDVPKFLREAENAIGIHGAIEMKVYDIEGCYPNMPKETIRFALRNILKRIESETGRDGVYVPKFSNTVPCSWKQSRVKAQKIPFQVMLDVMEFSLDNTFVKMPTGRLYKQEAGIPMGEPQSPGMTIGACAWMESEWLQTIAAQDRKYFRMKQFMDDILMVYAKTSAWDAERFVSDFAKSQCYQEPLRLEAGKDGTFLETTYHVEEGRRIRHKLKNENEGGKVVRWRYSHFYANAPFLQKRATLTACLRKVHEQASDPEMLRIGALDKMAEFRKLRYPESVLFKACNRLGASTGEGEWIRIRDTLRLQSPNGPKAGTQASTP